MNRKNSVPLIAAVIAIAASAAPAAELHVGPGQTYTTIQSAINAAINGDTVIVADGIYTGDGNRDIDFKGKAITVQSENGPESCIIDCQGSESQPHRGFYFHRGESSSALLQGVTIIDGWGQVGGGILCEDSSPSIRNCVIKNNLTNGMGFTEDCQAQVTDCTIEDNGDDGVNCDGLGSFDRCNPVFERCGIRGNARQGADCDFSNAIFIDCDISKNGSDGIRLSFVEDFWVVGCVISGNEDSGLEIVRSSGFIVKCEIYDHAQGAGVEWGSIDESPGIIRSSIIRDNRSASGGGIECSGELYVNNCVIVNNHGWEHGGGIVVHPGSNMNIYNSIIRDNASISDSQLAVESHNEAGRLGVYSCNIQGGRDSVTLEGGAILEWGEGNIDVDPGFAFDGDYHLLAGSACIDAGTNSSPQGTDGFDPDGNVRVLDGDGDGEAVADIGVYEFNPEKATIAVSSRRLDLFSLEGSTDAVEKSCSVRSAGGIALNWQILEDCSWVEMLPGSGVTGSETEDIEVRVEPNGLAHGVYTCEVEIVDEEAVNSPVILDVRLYINTTIHVPADANSIQIGINNAVDGDMVLVADGVYTGGNNRNITLRGKAITLKSEYGPEACVIDGEGEYRLFYITDHETNSTVIDGFTITNGYDDNGAGAIVTGLVSSPVIQNCIIKDCSGGPYSFNHHTYGAILCRDNPKILNCTITNNYRGGIFCGGEPHISGCVISENYEGPGVYFFGNYGKIEKCVITSNAGGIHLHGTYAEIDRCQISGNVLPDTLDQGHGAGIFCWNIYAKIMNSLIVGNMAEVNGGGVAYSGAGSIGIENCTIAGNRGGDYGGGIWVWPGSVSVNSSIIENNEASNGRQVALGLPDSSSHSVLVSEYSLLPQSPDDIYIGPAGEVMLKDGNKNCDPLFAAPGEWDDNGTAGDLLDDIWIEGDYHLQWGSPCIDAGDSQGDHVAEKDIDGESRVVGEGVDMGAYEFIYRGRLVPDGDFALKELGILAEYWLSGGCEGRVWCDGTDFDKDGYVRLNDLTVLVDYWQTGSDSRIFWDSSPVTFWQFDETTGTLAADSSLLALDGTLINMDDTDWVPGKIDNGNALEFDGVDDYVEITGFTGVLGSHSRTVCAWIKTSTTAGGDIVFWGDARTVLNRWSFYTRGGGKLAVGISLGFVIGTTNVCDGQWHHVAAVFANDGTPDIAETRLYVDGEEETISASMSAVPDTLAYSDVLIGSNGTAYFNGLIDEVRIYDRPLTADEIAALVP